MKITHDSHNHLQWYCDTCGHPIAPGSGFVGVQDVHAADLAARDRERVTSGSITLGDLLAETDNEIQWSANHHGACAPDDPQYGIDVAELTTTDDVIKMTAHLMGKSWLLGTDWDEVLELVTEAADNSGVLSWTCAVCQRPVEDEEGYLGVEPSKAVLQMDRPQEWRALHETCETDPNGPGYWLEIHEVRTVARLADVDRRIGRKTWQQNTNWRQMVDAQLTEGATS